jgi:UDP-N-acetylglucosamine transferase subunit ALG13
LPRLRKFGEVVNDHQLAIARKFETAGYLLAAWSENELADRIPQLMTFAPRRRQVDPDAVASMLARFLSETAATKSVGLSPAR